MTIRRILSASLFLSLLASGCGSDNPVDTDEDEDDDDVILTPILRVTEDLTFAEGQTVNIPDRAPRCVRP